MPSIAEARQTFTDLLGRAHYKGERILVTRRDTPYAFIGSIEDKDRLEEMDAIRSKLGLASIDELVKRLKELQVLDIQEVK